MRDLPDMEGPSASPEALPIIPFDENVFASLRSAAAEIPEKEKRDFLLSSSRSASRSAFSYVGNALARVAGEAVKEADEEGMKLPGGSDHELLNSFATLVGTAGFARKIQLPYEHPVHPYVNGKSFRDDLETDEERAEWDRMNERYLRNREVEIRTLKNIAARYTSRALETYLKASVAGGDTRSAIVEQGIPEDLADEFEQAVVRPYRAMPEGVRKATFPNIST